MIHSYSEILARFRVHLEIRVWMAYLLHFFLLHPYSLPEYHWLILASKKASQPKTVRFEPLAHSWCLWAWQIFVLHCLLILILVEAWPVNLDFFVAFDRWEILHPFHFSRKMPSLCAILSDLILVDARYLATFGSTFALGQAFWTLQPGLNPYFTPNVKVFCFLLSADGQVTLWKHLLTLLNVINLFT